MRGLRAESFDRWSPTGRLESSESPLRPPRIFSSRVRDLGPPLRAACVILKVPEDTVYGWLVSHPEFHQSYTRAREIRADFSFGEQILDVADDTSDDWYYNEKTGSLSVNKEVLLRSRVRIGVRQLHMSRLQPQTWGERQQIDLKSDWSLLTEDERRRRAEELIGMIEEIRNPPPGPPPIVYRPEEADDDQPIQARNLCRL